MERAPAFEAEVESDFQDFIELRKRGSKKVSFKDRDRKRRRAEAREISRHGLEEMNSDTIVEHRW